ncbi:MAG: hypothetical protein ACLTYW_01745 [Collinsella sp.]
MVEYDAEYPEYHLAESKGYASPEHIEAIRKHGLCPLHRVSFAETFCRLSAFSRSIVETWTSGVL